MFHFHLATLVLFALLAAVAIIDLRTMRIPDLLNLLVVASGLGATAILGGSLLNSAIGIVAGYGAMWGVSEGYRAVRGADGIGMGDAKLLAGAGAWLGWAGLPFVVLIASSVGLAWVALKRLAGRTVSARDALAFGPFLCVGMFVVWLAQAYG